MSLYNLNDCLLGGNNPDAIGSASSVSLRGGTCVRGDHCGALFHAAVNAQRGEPTRIEPVCASDGSIALPILRRIDPAALFAVRSDHQITIPSRSVVRAALIVMAVVSITAGDGSRLWLALLQPERAPLQQRACEPLLGVLVSVQLRPRGPTFPRCW